jgi:hypothetical protein
VSPVEPAVVLPVDAVLRFSVDAAVACTSLPETTTRPVNAAADGFAGAKTTARAALLAPVRRLEAAKATRARPATQPTSAISRLRGLGGAL